MKTTAVHGDVVTANARVPTLTGLVDVGLFGAHDQLLASTKVSVKSVRMFDPAGGSVVVVVLVVLVVVLVVVVVVVVVELVVVVGWLVVVVVSAAIVVVVTTGLVVVVVPGRLPLCQPPSAPVLYCSQKYRNPPRPP